MENALFIPFQGQPDAGVWITGQFLFQLHGQGGEYDISEAIPREDTPISSFAEIEYRNHPAKRNVTLSVTRIINDCLNSRTRTFISTGDGGDWISGFCGQPPEATGWRWIWSCLKACITPMTWWRFEQYTASWDGMSRLIWWRRGAASWFNLGSETITDNTNTAIRKTYKYPVPAGRCWSPMPFRAMPGICRHGLGDGGIDLKAHQRDDWLR